MNEDMDLIVFTETGHVMAGATRTQVAGPAPAIEDFVGDGIMLRDPLNGAHLMTIDSSFLSVETVARREDVLVTARYFQLVDGLPEPQADLGVATPVLLDGTNVTVTIPAIANALHPVDCVVIVQGLAGGDLCVQRVRVEMGAAPPEGIGHMPLPPGEHAYLLLVPEYRLAIDTVVVP